VENTNNGLENTNNGETSLPMLVFFTNIDSLTQTRSVFFCESVVEEITLTGYR